MQTLFFIIIALCLVGLFVKSYYETDAMQDASPVELTFKEWLQHTWLEIFLDFACFAAFCAGIDIGLAQKGIEVSVEGVNQAAFIAMVAAAYATANAIRNLVQISFLPIFSKLLKARNAKKLLRDKMRTAAARK